MKMKLNIFLMCCILVLSCNENQEVKSTNDLKFYTAEFENEKYGYIDSLGETLIEPMFEESSPFRKGYAIVRFKSKYGIIDKAGKFILPANYEDIIYKDGYYYAETKNEKFLINPKNRSIKEVYYSITEKFGNNLFVSTNRKGLYGLINEKGKIILPYEYDKIIAIDTAEWYRFIDGNLDERFAIISSNGKEGVINADGKIIIQPLFNYITAFSGNRALAVIKNKVCMIDTIGNFIIEPLYDVIGHFRIGSYTEFKDFIHRILLLPLKFNSGLEIALKNSKYGFINKSGKVEIDFIFEEAQKFSDGLAPVKKNGKWGFIDTTGKYLIRNIYDDASWFSDGLAKVKKGNKWGFINEKGYVIIPFEYDDVKFFNDGLCLVKKGARWGWIDKHHKVKIDFMFEDAWYFNNSNYTTVQIKGKKGIINKAGRLVIEPEYKDIYFDPSGFFWVYDEKYRLFDTNGRNLLRAKFQNIDYFEGPIAKVSTDSKQGYVNKNGKWIFGPY